LTQKVSFNEHFSIACGSGINLLIETVGVGKTIGDIFFLDNFPPVLDCLLVSLVVFSFVNNDLVKFAGGKSLTLIFLILITGSTLKIRKL